MSKSIFLVRKIEPSDDRQVAEIIRSSLEEFGANKPGTVYYDEEIDSLSSLFKTKPSSGYFVVLENEIVIGGGGYFPTRALPDRTCELVKMYVSNIARGRGVGKALLEKCMTAAKEAGYYQMYLETMPELKPALAFYDRNGFKEIDGPLGDSGHTGCSIFMIRKL